MKTKILDETGIIESEQQFIDLFKNTNAKKHPFKTLITVFKGQYLKVLIAAVLHIIKSSPGWVIP